jgi:hypothetical protein
MTSIPLSSSAPGWKPESFGDAVVGRIITLKERAQTEPGTGKVVTFNDGSPRMQLVVTVRPDDGSDDVTLYAKGGKFTAAQGNGQAMRTAIESAARDSGADSIAEGARLGIAFTGLSEAKPGLSPAKLFTAQYEAPSSSVPVDLFST